MTSVGIYQLKTHLSRFVEQANRGEEVEITRHGKVCARLVPPPPEELDEAAKQAERQRKIDHLTAMLAALPRVPGYDEETIVREQRWSREHGHEDGTP